MAVVINVYGKADLGQIQKAEAQLAGMKREVASQGGVWTRMGSVISSTGAKIASGLAAAGITRWLMNSVKAAQEAEVTTAKLNRAVTAAGTPWLTYKDRMLGVVDAQGQLSAYSGGQLKLALATLTQTTGSSDKALQLLALTTDLARGKNMDLTKAAQLVGKVAMGNTTALSRYGIVVKKGASATEALALLQGRFAGQARAYGNTAAGSQEKFNNALRKLQVTVGTALLPTVTAFMGKLVGILNRFQALPKPIQNVIVGMAALGAAAALMAPWVGGIVAAVKAMKLAAAATKVWAAAQWVYNAAMSANPIALVIIAVIALVAVFVVLWKKCAWFRNFWIGLWGKVKGVAAAVASALAAVGRKIVAALGWAWDKIAGAVKWFWGWAGPFIKAAITLWWLQIKLEVTAIVLVVKTAYKAIEAALRWFWGWAGPFIKAYVTAWWTTVRAVMGAIVAGVKAAWNAIAAAVRWFWGWAGPFIKAYVTAWWTTVRAVMGAIVAGVKAAWNAVAAAVRVGVAAVTAQIHAIRAVVSFLAGVWSSVRSAAAAAWNAVAAVVSSAWGRITAAARAGVSAVLGVVRAMGDKLKGVVNFGKLLYSAGQAIVQGLVDGIVGAWHWVTDKLKSLIGGLSSTAKKLLGISSPSKVFAQIGRQAAAGLAAGMDQGAKIVASAAAGMAASAPCGATGGYPVLAAAGGGVTRSVTIAPGAIRVEVSGAGGDPAAITRAVRSGIEPSLVQLVRELGRM